MLDFGSKVNIMTLVYMIKLFLRPKPTNVDVQKIDSYTLEIHGIILASFSLQDSQEKILFFEESFLLADISLKIVLKMPFLAFNNTNIKFV